jgi:hypothetical protein
VQLGKYIFDDHYSVDGFTKLNSEERLASSKDLEDALHESRESYEYSYEVRLKTTSHSQRAH